MLLIAAIVLCAPTCAGCGPASAVGCGGTTIIGTTTTTTSLFPPTTTLAGQAPSWIPSMTGAWMLDEASGTRANVTANPGLNLTISGTATTNDTTNKMEGAAAALFAGGGLVSTAALVGQPTEPLTCGFWERKTGATSMRILTIGSDHTMVNHNSDGNWGWQMGGNLMYFTPGNAANTWTHVALRQSGGTSQAFKDGKAAESSARPWVVPGAAQINFLLGDPGFTGQLDEVWCTNVALSPAAICRICSCGLAGEKCTCSGTTYTSNGRNAANCGGCTLPACNASTPP